MRDDGGAPPGFDLTRALDRATGSRAIQGNAVELLPDGPAIFEAIDDVIRAARDVVHFENYIIRGDETGMRVARSLAEARARGVTVRVLYDAFGSRGTSRALWRFLRGADVEVRAFHPFHRVRPIRVLQRNHRKLVAVDGRIALVGGFCIGDEWAGDHEAGRVPWHDFGVRVEGPAARAADLTFRRVWALAGPEISDSPPPPDVPAAGDAVVRIVEGVPGGSRVFRALSLLVAGASERLWLTEAYFMPPVSLLAGIVAAARDGVDVRLLAPGRSDVPIIRHFTRIGYRELLEADVRIFEWRGPMLHAKAFSVDGAWARVGSSNLNVSGLFGNYELDVLAHDSHLAGALSEQFRRDQGASVEVVLEARRRLPPRVRPGPPGEGLGRSGRPRSPREAGRAAVVTVRQIAAGARRSLAGGAALLLVALGVLFVAFPSVMGVLVAALALWLAVGAIWEGLILRRNR